MSKGTDITNVGDGHYTKHFIHIFAMSNLIINIYHQIVSQTITISFQNIIDSFH